MRAPNCLHVPVIKAGDDCAVTWSVVSGATHYELQRKVWTRNTEGDFDAVGGTVVPYPTHHFGPRWREVTAANLSWAAIKDRAVSWEKLRSLGKGHSLTWGEIMGHAKSWKDIQHIGKTWWQIAEAGSTDLAHVGCADSIPYGPRFVQYRVNARDGSGSSDFIASDVMPVEYVTLVEGDLELFVQANTIYCVAVYADAVKSFEQDMEIRYEPGMMELVNLHAHQPDADAAQCGLEIIYQIADAVCFRYLKEVPEDMELSGVITLIEFIAKHAGPTKFTLS